VELSLTPPDKSIESELKSLIWHSLFALHQMKSFPPANEDMHHNCGGGIAACESLPSPLQPSNMRRGEKKASENSVFKIKIAFSHLPPPTPPPRCCYCVESENEGALHSPSPGEFILSTRKQLQHQKQ
jgi:hypothetical protein